MEELQVLDLYNNAPTSKVDEFSKGIDSKLNVDIDYDKSSADLEWLSMMEETIRYIDNILRNPNRFIVNEEDIVKIELARRITVDSIKHLSKNTNLIQDFNEEKGEVKPAKILNINKEESYNTYENRFIYSLIQNMKSYVNLKKRTLSEISNFKDNKKLQYSGSSKLGKEKINVSLTLDSKVEGDGSSSGENDFLARVNKLEMNINDLTNSDVYKTIHKLHVSLVTSPIKKTNVILKNNNFQYALKLWNYMQSHMKEEVTRVKESKNDKIEGKIKEYIDETFLLNYLVLNTFSKDKENKKEKKELAEKIVTTMLQKLVDLNAIDKDELKDLIDNQYAVIRYRNVVNDKEIHKRFNIAINNYFNKVEALKLD